MNSQFSEYADIGRPATKLVSAKQIQVFLTDMNFGVVLYALIHAISPSHVTRPPQFQLKVTLGSSNPAEARTYLKVGPSQRDFAFRTKVTYPDNTEQVVARSLDQSGIFPVKMMEGDIYFEVPKTAAQRVLSCVLEISG